MSSTPHPDPADVPAPKLPETGGPETEVPAAEPFGSETLGAPVTDAVPENLETEPPAAAPTTGAGTSQAHDREADLKPLYAVAGLTDLVVGAVRSTLVDTQQWASARLSEMRFRQAELEKQAAEMRERADDLGEQVKTLPETTRGRVGELQQQANHTYAELAGRGQRVVQTVADRVDPVFDRLQESINAARRRVTGRPGAVTAPTPGPTDIIVVEDTLEPADDLRSTPSGVPDEALVAEETILVDGGVPGDEREDDLDATDPDDGDTTTQR